MKKRIIIGCIIAVVAAIAAINVTVANKTATTLSDLALANVEALATGEYTNASPCGGPKSEATNSCKSENSVNCKDLTGCQ
jgi:hypothetical protein